MGKRKGMPRCAIMEKTPVFLEATEHKWPLPHQAAKKRTFKGNVGNVRKLRELNLWSLRNQTHMDLLSLYWEACAFASCIFRTLWGTLVNKGAKNFMHSFFGFICITAIEFKIFF